MTETKQHSARTAPEKVLLVAAFGAFLAFLDATVVNVAFPDIREDFEEASVSDLSWVLNAYNIVFASFLVVFGRLTDLLGRRRMFSLGTALFTLASVLCAVAPSLELLVAARVLQAVGAAVLVPASLAVVVEAFPPERRSHAVGLWGASAAVAAGLGPPAGGALVEIGGWRLAFLINLPIGIAAVMTIRANLVESRAPGRRKMPDLRGALLLAAGLSALTTALIQGNEWGWASLPVLGCAVVALVLTGGFVASSLNHPQPVLDPGLLVMRPFTMGNIATVIAGMGFYAYMLTNILWLMYVWGYSILQAGSALVPGAVVAAVVAGALGEVAQKHGYRRIIVPGALVWCAAYVWYAEAVGPDPAFLSEWLPGQVLSGIGVGATLPLLTSAALASVPGGRYATASAVLSSSRQLGGVLGISILVVIIGTPTAANAAEVLRDGWIFCAGCFAATALCGLVLGRVEEQEATEEQVVRSGLLQIPEQRGGAEAAQLIGPEARPASFLSRLPADVRADLEAAGTRRILPGGEWLFREGEAAQSMFVVVSGRLEVVVGGRVVRELGTGAVLGELALLTDGLPRSASVRARRDSELIEVGQDAFFATLRRGPEAPIALATALAEELRSASPTPDLSSTTPALVGVVALHPGAPAAEVGRVVAEGLAASLRVIVTGEVSTEQLERMERDHDRVVLVADDPGSAWWQACLRQSDRLVAVASGDAAPPEDWPGPDGADVLLVGPVKAAPAEWSAALTPWQLIGVDNVDAASLRALIARIAGRSLGLVLAGGGARALTHVGVLRELEDAGLHVDRVVGTSLGAVVAAGHALGWDGETLENTYYEEFVRGNPITDYTFPAKALTKGRRTPLALQRVFGKEQLIESMARQFRCVSVDLYGRTPVVHRNGLLWDAVTASCRLPILYPPWQSGSRLLIDGCVLDNLPVPVLLERNEGPIVAVNIGAGEKPVRRDGPPKVPPLGDTLLRVMTIGGDGTTQRAAQQGAFVITPASMGVGMMEYHQMDTMVESGRRAVRALLEATGGQLADVHPELTVEEAAQR